MSDRLKPTLLGRRAIIFADQKFKQPTVDTKTAVGNPSNSYSPDADDSDSDLDSRPRTATKKKKCRVFTFSAADVRARQQEDKTKSAVFSSRQDHAVMSRQPIKDTKECRAVVQSSCTDRLLLDHIYTKK